ncbi:MAG: peptidylprolyl isomerase [Acetobacteraceae bacterium]
MPLRRLTRLALVPIAVLLTAASDPNAVVAQRGDVKVTVGELQQAISLADPAVQARLKANPASLPDFVRDRVLRDTLLEVARKEKWDQKPDVKARAEEASAQVIVQSFVASKADPEIKDPTDAEVAAAYEANKGRLMMPRQYHVAQIAIVVPPNSFKSTEDEIEKKVRDIRAQVAKPKADFGEVARKMSDDKPTAAKGGDLGWVREDQLIPPIRAALVNMKDGQIGDPIRSGDSWHIVKLIGTKPPTPMTLDQAREGLVKALRQARGQAAARAYIQSLLQSEPITLNEIELTKAFAAPKDK